MAMKKLIIEKIDDKIFLSYSFYVENYNKFDMY